MVKRAKLNPNSGDSVDTPVPLPNSTPNENILQECHKMYVDSANGLVKIGQRLGLNLLAPRRKIVIMLIGNHSAGKSSFINWYIGEHVQRTGVAVETQGFTFITSGKKRESLTGKATLHLFPHFKNLESIMGVVDYMSTEISASKEKRFNLVTFIDTPGLVDGDVYYPYDVDKAVLWLADLADQVFVFFDPIGQALCKRSLNLAEKINSKWSEKIRFYLSKADEAGDETDRQKVMMQIVQELCKRPGLNKCGFDMPTIYVPDVPYSRPTRCVNQIESVCNQIEKTINYTVQNTLNTLEKDCNRIIHLIDERIGTDNEMRTQNHKRAVQNFLLITVGMSLLTIAVFNLFTNNFGFLKSFFGEEIGKALQSYLSSVYAFWSTIPKEYHGIVNGVLFAISLLFLILGCFYSKSNSTLNRKEKKKFVEWREHVLSYLKRRHTLYKQYLDQCVNEGDYNI